MASISPTQFTRLVKLNARLSKIIELAAQQRNSATGAFSKVASIDPKKLRKAWSIPPGRRISPNDVFKNKLLAAIRQPK